MKQGRAEFPDQTRNMVFLDGDHWRPISPYSPYIAPEIVATTIITRPAAPGIIPEAFSSPAAITGLIAEHVGRYLEQLGQTDRALARVSRGGQSGRKYMLYRRPPPQQGPVSFRSSDQATLDTYGFDHDP